MKPIAYTLLAGLCLFTSCIEDEGNYDYANVNPPQWLQESSTIVGRQGENIELDGSSYFVWAADAEKRKDEVTYEWMVNGNLISDELKASIPIEEFMEKANVKTFTGSTPTYGTFNVVEKATGVKYMHQVMFWCYPKFSAYSWIVLSEKDNIAKLSGIRSGNDGYELLNDAYEASNDGAVIPGKPLTMNRAVDKHISENGSITVITDQGAFELNANDLSLSSRIGGDQFLDGEPAGFQPIARADHDGSDSSDPTTFIISKDGKLYTRVMSKNYLGGKYLSEPYYLDDRGYKLTMFGNAIATAPIPCYDELNRRIVMASVVETTGSDDDGNPIAFHTPVVKALDEKPSVGTPVNEFPEGSKILYMGMNQFDYMQLTNSLMFICVYTTPDNPNAIVSHFLVRRNLTQDLSTSPFTYSEFALAGVDESTVFLTSGNTRNTTSMNACKTIFYSVGNQVKYLQFFGGAWSSFYPPTQGALPVEIESNITYMSLSYESADEMIIGCENGDVYLYNIRSYSVPQLLFKGNTGGKVMTARQLGARRPTSDNFNI